MSSQLKDSGLNGTGWLVSVLCGIAGGALPLIWGAVAGSLGNMIVGGLLFTAAEVVELLLLCSVFPRRVLVKCAAAVIVFGLGVVLAIETSIVPKVFAALNRDYVQEYGGMNAGDSFGLVILYFPMSIIMLLAGLFIAGVRAAKAKKED